jgi:mannose/fructose/N-acetylgalactosamine-specific phosphotransferase system component IID
MAALTGSTGTRSRSPRPPLGRSLLRLFTVQGSWNYERMQGVGVGVAEEPLLRDLRAGGNGTAYRAAVARGAHFFNAHPYLCGLAVGAAARAEHDGVPPDQVERLRTALCGPLGSLGDRLVWAGWLPLTSALALVGVALGRGHGLRAVLGFLLVYNIGHVSLRWWALRAGWRYGAQVARALREPMLQRATALSGPAMALAVGFALPLVAVYLSGTFEDGWRLAVAAVGVGGFGLLRWLRSRLTGLRLGLILLAVAALVGLLWR